MAQQRGEESQDEVLSGQNEGIPSEGILRYFQWVNEDWLSLIIGLTIVLLALVGLLDWVRW